MKKRSMAVDRRHFRRGTALCAGALAGLAMLGACSGSGGTARTVAPAVPTPTASPTPSPSPVPAAHIFVANAGNGTVTGYASNASGNVPPVATITISSANLAGGGLLAVSTDTAGNIYAASGAGIVTVYPPNPVGTLSEAPTATIDAAAANSNCATAQGMGVDPSGRIYVTCPATIVVFAAHPVGTVTTPVATITSTNPGTGITQLVEVHSVAFDAQQRIYVTDNVYGIEVFPPNPSGTINEQPVANIPRTATTGMADSNPYGIALDTAGRIYTREALETGGAQIHVFAANPVGTVNAPPLATIVGSATGLDNQNGGLALDAAGHIFAVNHGLNTVTEYAANPSGTLNEAPIATITGSATGLNGPFAIALH